MASLIRLSFLLAFAAAWTSPAHAQAQQPTHQSGWPCSGTVSPAYVRTAEATGGVVMLFTPAEISGAVAEMTGSNKHPDVVFRATGRVADGLHEFEVPIDSTVESASFFISLQCLDAISILDPAGEEVNPAAPGIEHHAFTAVRLLTIPTPDPGSYRVRLAGRGFFSVIVRARTELQLGNVTFTPGGFPMKREPQLVELALRGAAREVGFQTISASAGVLDMVSLDSTEDEEGERTFSGAITPPATDFRLAVIGVDERGFRFQRVEKKLHVK